MTFKLIILFSLFNLFSAQAQPETYPGIYPETYPEKKLDELIKSFSKTEPFFGNILVKKGNSIVLEKSYGYADLNWKIKNTSDSKFMLASVSKQFTAAAISQLVNEGRLTYGDPLSKFFSTEEIEVKDRSHFEKITIKDLLSHRAGLLKDVQPDHVNLTKKQSLQALVEQVFKDERLFSHPYGEFYYSNVGYTFLARIVEIVTKFDFDMYLSFKLFRKVNLKNSGVFHRSKIIPNMAAGYYRNEDDKFSAFCCNDSSTNMGSHNLYSTARDLAAWVEEISGKNLSVPKGFLSFENVPSENGVQYFNGLFKRDTELGVHFWHDGFSGGYATRVSFFPEQDLTIVILLNRVNVFTAQGQIEGIHEKMLEMY